MSLSDIWREVGESKLRRRFPRNRQCGGNRLQLAAPGAQEGAREAGAPRGPRSPESSCTHFSSVPKTQVTFVPLPFLGRVFDLLARDRKASLLCWSAPLVRQWRGGHPGVERALTCWRLAATQVESFK